MPDMHHEIPIEASSADVYRALTTAEGLRSWWTADSQAEAKVGGTTELGFYGRSTVFRMRIAELKPNQRVVWECVGDDEEWKGTRLTWDLTPKGEKIVLHFVHADWHALSSYFAACTTTWGMLLYRLKDYLEGRSPGPYFPA